MLTKAQYIENLMYEFKVELTKMKVSFSDEQSMTQDALDVLSKPELQGLIQEFCDYYNLLHEPAHSAVLQ